MYDLKLNACVYVHLMVTQKLPTISCWWKQDRSRCGYQISPLIFVTVPASSTRGLKFLNMEFVQTRIVYRVS